MFRRERSNSNQNDGQQSWKFAARNSNTRLATLLLLACSFSTLTCEAGTKANRDGVKTQAPIYGYEVVHIFPHDPNAYTQGLIFQEGKLLESTGRVGQSSLRRVELETGNVLQKSVVESPYFAEGIALLKGKIYQLTWLNQLGFIYDAATFERIGTFNYAGEGWGLATDGQFLILSDGSNQIRFLDPDTFKVNKTIKVRDGNNPIRQLNELEFIQGEIYANVWHADRIARINPQSGDVAGWIDLKGIISPSELHDGDAVLNGIAYDEATGRLFVTGKLWPTIFEIRLVRK